MSKILWLVLLSLFVTNCAYKPVVDTAGRSGTFNQSKADQITNDLQHCDVIAEQNSNFVGDIIHAIFDPDTQTEYEVIYKKCLTNRGHSILN